MEREVNIISNEIIVLNEKKYYEIFKRIFDLASSSIALVLMSPFFLLVALAIRIESKGPIVFGHPRIGKDGKGIRVYKFRSMYENANEIFENFTEEQKEEYYENFKLDNDPRVTKVGKIIRKTSLDELPQLINIIKGEMSVVGPRPIVEKEIVKYGENFKKAFSVKCGLTGYWQSNGRSDTTYNERVEMDLYYVDNRSFGFDMKIIMRTVTSVIKREGAF